jgi:hypothetical protein
MQAFSALVAALTIAACTPALSRNASGAEFAVIDSGVVGDPSLSDKPIWIDNDRILYVEQTNEKRIRASDGYEFNARRVVLWDLRTRQIKRMHELTGFLCYRDGYFHSALWDFAAPERFPIKHTYGRLENGLQTIETEWKALSFDPGTCRPHAESPKRELPEWTKGKTVRELAEIGGILVLDDEKEKSDRNVAVSFHPQGRAEGIAMPFKRREMDVRGYQPFKQAYFIVAEYFKPDPRHPNGGYNVSPPPKGWVHHVWWIYGDGRIEQARLVANDQRSWASIVPYRDGYAWILPGGSGRGLYLTTEQSDQLVFRGFMELPAISPDGCRIATKHSQSSTESWVTATLKVIDLCKGDRK